MSQNHLADLTVEELQGYFSDFHKDFFGFRPRYATPEQWRSREWLEASINAIHNTMDKMKETFAGREELRSRGWIIDEPIPELVEQARWLQQERDREYAEAVADIDAEYFGEAV
jgi:predicted ATPase